MMPRWPEKNRRILFVPLKFVNVGCLCDFMILSAILDYELSLVYDIWAWVLKLFRCLYEPEGIDGYYLSHQIMMPRWPERNLQILCVPLEFVNAGCLGDFIILSAILDYELSLVYDIWAWVLKLLWCLYDPKWIVGYYLSH